MDILHTTFQGRIVALSCPICGRVPKNSMEAEFIIKIGECHSCDHLKGEEMEVLNEFAY